MKGPESKLASIQALTPRGAGHRFVLYGDSCSGVPGAPHEATFASVNAVVARLSPPPEFIIFPGDEIIGLTADEDALRAQWRHWFDVEMAWLNQQTVPLYHCTSNHTTYDPMSERVFAEMLAHLPRNGPPGQEGLSWFVRRGDLLMVFVHTSWSRLGGEGHVETAWLGETLRAHADARWKFVVGHHPVFPINGYAGAYQRQIGPEYAETFWSLLVENGVFAYLCSHILAFDVQIHVGVLQIASAGAGTAHRMPEGVEYLHCVQAALDADGLRYQVLDTEGVVRERLSWPFDLPPCETWARFVPSAHARDPDGGVIAWHFRGALPSDCSGQPQTLLSAWSNPTALAPIWIGLTGPQHRLTVALAPTPGRSPHQWLGPALTASEPFDLQLALRPDMGPGGLLWRSGDGTPWTSLEGASAWGPEQLEWPECWHVGHGQNGPEDRPFTGSGLDVTYTNNLGR